MTKIRGVCRQYMKHAVFTWCISLWNLRESAVLKVWLHWSHLCGLSNIHARCCCLPCRPSMGCVLHWVVPWDLLKNYMVSKFADTVWDLTEHANITGLFFFLSFPHIWLKTVLRHYCECQMANFRASLDQDPVWRSGFFTLPKSADQTLKKFTSSAS